MDGLIYCLTHTPVGPIHDTDGLECILSECWEQFDGSNAHGMTGRKLLGRMEQVEWLPPFLSFVIERHTIPGSLSSTLEHWVVDLHRNTVSITKTEQRKLCPLSLRDSAETVAKELAQLILSGRRDDRLQWDDDGTVCVIASWSSPRHSLVSGTLGVRRRKLRKCIHNAIRGNGWQHVGGSRFMQTVVPALLVKRQRSSRDNAKSSHSLIADENHYYLKGHIWL